MTKAIKWKILALRKLRPELSEKESAVEGAMAVWRSMKANNVDRNSRESVQKWAKTFMSVEEGNSMQCKCIDRSHEHHKGKVCESPATTEDGHCEKCDFERHLPAREGDFIHPDPASH
jgi:hypothetical protein